MRPAVRCNQLTNQDLMQFMHYITFCAHKCTYIYLNTSLFHKLRGEIRKKILKGNGNSKEIGFN